MTPFEIAFIIIGILSIVASCLLVDKKNEDTIQTEYGNISEQMLNMQLDDANKKLKNSISEVKEQVITNTQDEMNRVANEKIMAINEYSEQVLSNIDKNHQEVMFLYSMLSDKESDLKKSISEIQKINSETYQNIQSKVAKDSNQTKMKYNVANRQISAQKKQKHTNEEKAKVETEENYSEVCDSIMSNEFSAHMNDILRMDKEGNSIIEISRKLGLGQGEVKLVLDYNAKKSKK